MLGALLESSEASCGFEIVQTLFAKQNFNSDIDPGHSRRPSRIWQCLWAFWLGERRNSTRH